MGLGSALLALVLLPFLLAGRTGDALWIAAPVLATLVYVLLREGPRCLAFYRSLWPLAWGRGLLTALAALVATLGLGTALSLLPSDGPLDWSLGSLFGVEGGAAGVNGFAIPLGTPLLALLYAPPALLALPLLAWWEEDIFRRGTRGVRSALIRSALFGLLHSTAGVSLGAASPLAPRGWSSQRPTHRLCTTPRHSSSGRRSRSRCAACCCRGLPEHGHGRTSRCSVPPRPT